MTHRIFQCYNIIWVNDVYNSVKTKNAFQQSPYQRILNAKKLLNLNIEGFNTPMVTIMLPLRGLSMAISCNPWIYII